MGLEKAEEKWRRQTMEKYDVFKIVKETGIVAIVRGTQADDIIRLADALHAGGIRAIEVTCNTKGYLSRIEALTTSMAGQMAVGAGTVLDTATAKLVIDAGAQFVLAPNLNQEVVQLVHQYGKMAIPGVATPTEIMEAYRLGVDIVKLFPAGALGARYLKDVRAPLSHAAIMPVGGITLDNLPEFVKAGAFAFGIGGELVDKKALAEGNYSAITAKAQAFIRTFAAAQNGERH